MEEYIIGSNVVLGMYMGLIFSILGFMFIKFCGWLSDRHIRNRENRCPYCRQELNGGGKKNEDDRKDLSADKE
jgi:hypothetical protein